MIFSDYEGFILTLSNRNRYLLTLLCIVIVIGLWWGFAFRYMYSTICSYRSDLKAAQSLTDKHSLLVKEQQALLDYAKKHTLFDSSVLSEYIPSISMVAHNSGLKFHNSSIVKNEKTKCHELHLHADGQFNEFLRFLKSACAIRGITLNSFLLKRRHDTLLNGASVFILA